MDPLNGNFGTAPSAPPSSSGMKGFRISEIGRKALIALAVIAVVGAVASFGAYLLVGAALALTVGIICAVAASALGMGLLYKRVVPYLPPTLQNIAHQIHSCVLELMAFFIVASTYFVDLTKRNAELSTKEKKQPILLVHGYLHNSSAWLYFKKRLEAENMGPVWTINLGNPFQSIDDYAEKVGRVVDEMFKQTQQPVRLVGHSMGGIVSSIASFSREGTVSKVVTIGSPLEGTYLGRLGFGKCAQEMHFGSSFLNIFKDHKAASVSYYHISSKADYVVFPRSSADFRSDPNPKVDRYQVEDIGHISLLFSDRVIDSTIEFLNS